MHVDPIARFAPADMTADLTPLPASERQALRLLIAAARIMDALFLRQVWAGNETMLQMLARDRTEPGQARLHAFLLNKGPWSRIDDNAPLVPGAPPKPAGANFYPSDMTREEVRGWLASLPESDRAAATGFFTTIRRDVAGRLIAVPYSLEYQPELAEAARLLRAAAASTAESSLARFLDTRATAFLSNEYYESDVAWMELDAAIEPVIGPYEVYEDEWFNYKAAFEAFVTVTDRAETARIQTFASHLQALEDALPIAPAYRNPSVGALTPIRVVNVVFTAGDANRGVQTAAFNLPNDERVIREKGSKSVMLRNVQDAKFRMVLGPIARAVLTARAQDAVSFDAFFTHILLHELMHGLGPHDIVVGGRPSTVRRELMDTYSAIEEAKADVSALWAFQQLVARGEAPAALERSIYVTFLASMFRSLRFGVNEAHALGVAMQLNYLLHAGAVVATGDDRFDVDLPQMRSAVTSLTSRIMTVQAEGSLSGAKQLIDELGELGPPVTRALGRLSGIPVDIEPVFAGSIHDVDPTGSSGSTKAG